MTAFFPVSARPWSSLPQLRPVVYRRRRVLFGSHSFATWATDSPPSTPIRGRLLPFRWRSEIGTDSVGRYAGASPIGLGEIELVNTDGGLDGLVATSVSEGGAVAIMVGKREPDIQGRKQVWAYADFGRIMQATAEQWVVEAARNPRLRLRDATVRLLRPAQPNLYGGSGGLGGSLELAGLTKPICYGSCRNVTPVLIDPDSWTYQWHDGAAEGVLQVRDRGVRLSPTSDAATYQDLQDALVPAGAYMTCLAEGCFRLGFPPVGAVTADVLGAAAGRLVSFFDDGTSFDDGTGFANEVATRYVDTTAGIVSRLLTDRGVVKPDEIETTSFAIVDRDQPARIGIYLPGGDTSTLLEVTSRLAIGIGAHFGQEPWGRYELRRFEGPPATARRQLTDRQILEVQTVSLPYRAPPMQWQVAWGRNWTLQTAQDLGESTLPGDRQLATRERAFGVATNQEVRAALPSPRVGVVESFFESLTDAAAEARRLAELYTLDRGLYRITTPMLGARLRRGSPIIVRYPHPRFSNGRAGRIVGVEVNAGARQCVLTVFA